MIMHFFGERMSGCFGMDHIAIVRYAKGRSSWKLFCWLYVDFGTSWISCAENSIGALVVISCVLKDIYLTLL